jgi:hypothetical protein
MRTKVIQTNFTGGIMAETLAGQIELEKYYKSCLEAENVIIMPHGGLKRRAGLSRVTSSYINKYVRLEAFEFSTSQAYLIAIATDYIHIFKDGTQVATVASPYTTQAIIDSLDFVQSADTMIMVHEDIKPKKLVRGANDASWTISDITFTNIPTYDFGSGAEAVWSVTRGYPRTVTFHQGRLYFGGSKSRISSVWGSVVNDFFNFNIGTGLADEAIFDTLDTDQYNKIEGIFSGRNLQVFTTGGEFYNGAKIITPSDSSWLMQTNYGSKRIRPISVDGATLYVSRNGRGLRQFIYNFNEDAFVSVNTLLLADHLVTNIKTVDKQTGTSENISDFVYVVDDNGTCLVLNTMRNENILGWTKWTTDGLFKDCCVVGSNVYFLVTREGTYYIEKLTEGTYTDHNTTKIGTNFTTIATNEESPMKLKSHKVVCDGAIQNDKTPDSSGVITLDRPANYAEVGLGYNVTVTTMPINFNTNEGMCVNARKRVLKTVLRVYNTRGAIVQGELLQDRKFPIVFNQNPDPYSGILEISHLGYYRVNNVEVVQTDPLPFHLLQIESETES